MQGINFNQRSTSKKGRSPEPHLTVEIHVVWWASRLVPSGFSNPFMSRVCCCASVPSRVFVMCSPLELSIKPSAEDWLLPFRPLPAARSAVQYHPWSKVDIRGQPLQLHSMGREQGWDHLRANPWFGVFWFIPTLLSKPIFGQPPL